MISGRETAADGIIAMAGANNAFSEFAGYKPVNEEAIIAAKPDAILVMQRGEHALSADMVFSQPGLAADARGRAEKSHRHGWSLFAWFWATYGKRGARS